MSKPTMLRALVCITALAIPMSFPVHAANHDVAQSAHDTERSPSALLRHDVKRALADDPALEGAHTAVSAREGRVTLAGVVASEAQRRRAMVVTAGVRGVRAVEDALEIEPAARLAPAFEATPHDAFRREPRRRVARAGLGRLGVP